MLARADVISLHAPSTAETRHIINRETLAKVKKGARLINTARGELIDTAALIDALKSGRLGGAAIDVYDVEPPTDPTLQSLPQVIATPHIAASTREGQERVGIDTVDALCEFLERGIVRNAVNAPALAPAVAARLGPMLPAAQRFGQVASALLPGPLTSVGVRVYGELAALPSRPVADAILTGLFSGMLAEGVSPVNVRAIAGDRGVEVVESQSSRAHDHVDVVSLKLCVGHDRALARSGVLARPRRATGAHRRRPRRRAAGRARFSSSGTPTSPASSAASARSPATPASTSRRSASAVTPAAPSASSRSTSARTTRQS